MIASARKLLLLFRLLEAPGALRKGYLPLDVYSQPPEAARTGWHHHPKVSTCIFSVDGNRITYYYENYILPTFSYALLDGEQSNGPRCSERPPVYYGMTVCISPK